MGQIRRQGGFDFSEGKELAPDAVDNPNFDLVLTQFEEVAFPMMKMGPPLLISETGIADLGAIDFGRLIPEGIPPDLRPDSLGTGMVDSPTDRLSEAILKKGHTYVIWSREGGIAIMYVFEMESDRPLIKWDPSYRFINNAKFDWIYNPDGMLDTATAVQLISWGQLKQRISTDEE